MKLRTLAANTVTALLVVLALIAITITLAPFVGWRVDTVLSGSMEPAIATGDMVIIGPVSADNVHVGDVIAFSDGSNNICHRVLSIEAGPPVRFVTKGDANGTLDPHPVTADNVKGKIVLSIPKAGYITHFIKTPLGLFMTILLPLLILIGWELKDLIWDDKKEDNPREPQ
jgi:signal peptidase